MFKKIPPKVKLFGSSEPTVRHVSSICTPHGSSTVLQTVPQSQVYKDLPAPENFALDVQLKAGVPLNPVNPVVFHKTELSDAEQSAIDSVVNPQEPEEPVEPNE